MPYHRSIGLRNRLPIGSGSAGKPKTATRVDKHATRRSAGHAAPVSRSDKSQKGRARSTRASNVCKAVTLERLGTIPPQYQRFHGPSTMRGDGFPSASGTPRMAAVTGATGWDAVLSCGKEPPTSPPPGPLPREETASGNQRRSRVSRQSDAASPASRRQALVLVPLSSNTVRARQLRQSAVGIPAKTELIT